MKKHDVKKLPGWAQNEISRLKMNLADVHKRMNEMLGDNPVANSNVMLPYFNQDMHDQYLPKGQRVQFLLPDSRRPGDRLSYVEVHHDPDGILNIHGSQPIWIEPTASNCFKIRFREM